MYYLIVLLTFYLIHGSTCQEYRITPITTSSGLYYEKVGEVLLSNNNWQFVTSVDYGGYLAFYQYLFNKSDELRSFCDTLSSKECTERYDIARTILNRITDTNDNMAHFLGIESTRRVKRFWAALGAAALPLVKPLGERIIGKIFGEMKQQNLEEYNNQLAELANSQKEVLNQVNQQATIFLADSERKNFQINWLNRTQDEIIMKIKILQGTVQANDEETKKKITDLQEMLAETKHKLQMQADIQRKLVDDVNKIKDNLVTIEKEINEIKVKVFNNMNKIKLLEVNAKIDSISTKLNYLLTQFEIEQKQLFDVIKNANRGFLDPYITTPLNLIEMMQTAQATLPEGTKFPFFPTVENARKIYNLIKPVVYLYKNKILFVLTMPLVNHKTFSLHKMTSLPKSINNKFVFVLPKQPYLIIDKNDDEYMLLSSNDFREFCKDVTGGKFLCEQIQPNSKVLTSSDCETQIFLNSNKISDSCNNRVMSLDKSIFLQLQQPMSWIYIIPDSDIVIFTCGHTRKSMKLEGSGLIQLNNSCTVRVSDFELQTISRLSASVISSYMPTVDITNFISLQEVENYEMKSLVNKRVLQPFDFNELEKYSINIKQLALLNNTAISSSNIYVLIIVIGIVVLGFLIVVIYMRKYLKKKLSFV